LLLQNYYCFRTTAAAAKLLLQYDYTAAAELKHNHHCRRTSAAVPLLLQYCCRTTMAVQPLLRKYHCRTITADAKLPLQYVPLMLQHKCSSTAAVVLQHLWYCN